jgi:hypothetical protein
MRRGIVVLSLAVGFASPVYAAPGDPRLIQGVLEWPAKLTVEPFVVIRADDGKWYYSEVKSAKHLEVGPLTAGARVAVLGSESAKPHEIIAIAVGSGDATALALALMPHVTAPAAAAAPAAPLAVESPSGTKAPATAAKPEPPAAPTPAAASAPTTGPAGATGSASAPAPTPTPTAPVAPGAPAGPTAPPAPSPTLATDKAAKPPTPGATVPVPANPQLTEPSAPAPPALEKATPATGGDSEPAAERPRWAELQGTVKVIAGNWIVVRSESGQLILVDLSTVRGGASSVRPGASISVYGTPGDQKFQAMGILQPDNRPPAKPATVPPRR